MKVTKYNKVYEVSEQEVEKWIKIFTDMLKMNEDGEYTGPVAAEAVSQEDIDKEIKQLKEKIKKLTERDNDTIANLTENFENVRSDGLGWPTVMSVCLHVKNHAKAKRFDNLLKCDILLKLKEFRGILKESQKKSYKSANKLT